MTPQTTIPAAPGFDLDPADQQYFWQQDKMHFPDPLAPMESAMLERSLGAGFGYGARAYNAPIESVQIRTVGGYQYQSMIMATGTPEEMAANGARAEQAVRATLGRLDELWTEDILPEVRRHIGFWDGFDLAGATRAALSSHVAETWRRLERIWELHFEMVLPAYLAISEFDELYRGLFPDAGPLDSYRLLEGLPNMTVEVGQALWRLSRRAVASPEVHAVFTNHAAVDVPVALYATPEGRAFLAELEAYVDRYGRRADKWTLLAPSWTEDPTPVVERLQDFVRRTEIDEPAVVTAAAAAGREQAIAAAREQLAGYPAAVVGQFEGLLAAAQAGTVISEDHNFWIDNMSIHHLRAVLLEGGRRLVDDGALTHATDVMMLTPEELQEGLDTPGADYRPTVTERADRMAQAARITPPPVLGTLPAGPPPTDDPFGRFAMKFNGLPPAAETPAGEIHGSCGSSGKVRGTARIIGSIAEAGRLAPGDILVAETTAPPWTPLFATVAAVVTDTGGVLSHCAVVAREYGIPAVVGTQVATVTIKDGDEIEVDGDAGIVRIV
ncbi:MAG TPA: PEP-utilizing enzyme [Solirubrobacteraceae bacterium]|nr:PEP-utilizing enzyme [Solirubrobacteraceae bacterium]